MTRYYLDASALVKLGVVEPQSDALRRRLDGYSALFTSRLSAVEVPRAIERKGSGTTAAVRRIEDVVEGVSIIELDEGLARAASQLAPPTMRSLDAIHLASALSIRTELDAFVTYDVRLGEAARSLGLSVVAPA